MFYAEAPLNQPDLRYDIATLLVLAARTGAWQAFADAILDLQDEYGASKLQMFEAGDFF